MEAIKKGWNQSDPVDKFRNRVNQRILTQSRKSMDLMAVNHKDFSH
jgi:hypothetical protein